MPEELAGPYRATLTKLQDAAPPMPASTVHTGPGRRARAALAPQVRVVRRHARPPPPRSARCTGPSGGTAATVAVKVQYPGAGQALRQRPQPGVPGGAGRRRLDPRPRHQADHGRAQGAGGRGAGLRPRGRLAAAVRQGVRRRPGLRDPARRAATASSVIVSEWMDGSRCRAIIASGTEERARRGRPALPGVPAGRPAARRAAARRPAPGQLPAACRTGGSACMDFGAVNRLPDGLPGDGPAARAAPWTGDAEGVLAGLREEGFVRPSIDGRRRAAAGLPRAVPRARCAPTRSGSPARGCAGCSATSTTRAARSAASA